MERVKKVKYVVHKDTNVGTKKDGSYIKILKKGDGIFLTKEEASIYKELNIIE